MLSSDLRQIILLPLGLATALFTASLGAQTLAVEGKGAVEIAPRLCAYRRLYESHR